jgi:hypothetical protein
VYENLMAEIGTELWACAPAGAQAVQKIENQVLMNSKKTDIPKN